jgi:hypothetical protein
VAVWGQDETEPVVRGPTVEQWLRPAGRRLLAFGRLLGPPADPDADEPTQRTYGLTVFGPGDRRPVTCSAPARSTGCRSTAAAPTST